MAILIDADRIAGQLAVVGNVTYPPRQLTTQEIVVAVNVLSNDVFVFGGLDDKEAAETALDNLRQWFNAATIS